MIAKAAILKNKLVYTGNSGDRHHHIIHAQPPGFFKGGDCVQGFVTDGGEFLNRELSAIHAFECGQINRNKAMLFSEDLW
jgi:hypothetical protein